MAEHEPRRYDYQDLNALGKAVSIGGGLARVTAHLLDRLLDRAADLVVETERAFRDGREGRIEDAKILEEHDER